MPSLKFEIPHSLGQEEAARRLKEKFAAARDEHQGRVANFREEWHDHTFSFGFDAMGMSISGEVAIKEECIAISTELPFAAMMFKGAIEQRIQQEITAMLA